MTKLSLREAKQTIDELVDHLNKYSRLFYLKRIGVKVKTVWVTSELTKKGDAGKYAGKTKHI